MYAARAGAGATMQESRKSHSRTLARAPQRHHRRSFFLSTEFFFRQISSSSLHVGRLSARAIAQGPVSARPGRYPQLFSVQRAKIRVRRSTFRVHERVAPGAQWGGEPPRPRARAFFQAQVLAPLGRSAAGSSVRAGAHAGEANTLTWFPARVQRSVRLEQAGFDFRSRV